MNLTKTAKIKGGIKAGTSAYINKTGIHSLSPEQLQEVSIKGKDAFLNKWKNPEFRQLHLNKIRFGKLVARFNKLRKPSKKYFGFI